MIINKIRAGLLIISRLFFSFPRYDQSRLKHVCLGTSPCGLLGVSRGEAAALHMDDTCSRLSAHVETGLPLSLYSMMSLVASPVKKEVAGYLCLSPSIKSLLAG